MRAHLLLISSVVLSTLGCTCGPGTAVVGGRVDGGGTLDAGAGGAAGGGSAGGGSAGGASLNDGGTFSGALVIAPRDVVVDVTAGQPVMAVDFSATANGAPVVPDWALSPPTLGTLDAMGRFTANTTGGTGTVSARYGAAMDSTAVRVRVRVVQNGTQVAGMDAGLGGLGGVGGEGEGGAVNLATVTVLGATPTPASGDLLLYPYDGTVWPKGLLPPLLQWRTSRSYDAVSISLECPLFLFTGTFAKTATPFVRHPIPVAAWNQAGELCAGQSLTLRVVFAAQGQAFGPLTQTWRVAPGSLKGVIYYNSYGTRLAKNYSGALGPDPRFGGATLSIRGSSTDPDLVAGSSGPEANCRVCHVVAADGSALLTQRGDNNDATSHYALRSGNAETAMTPGDGRYAWGALSPDGTVLFSNTATLQGSRTAPSELFQVPSGASLPSTGLPAGLGAATPVFSPDGRQLAFNHFAGVGADQRSLAMLRFTPPGTFSDFSVLYTPPAGQTAVFPSYLPTNRGVVFQVETVSNGRFGETRSTCDSSGPCSNIGTRAELWWVDVMTKQARRLDRLNGLNAVPTGPESHDDDATLNYEPTVGPIPSGGYAWVIFTSRRLYGNVATINPWWSDPRFHDISATPTTKKLWVAAIDLNAAPGTDPSHPAFYLPAQELLAGNSRGYWAADPCRGDGERCGSGDECCGGYCYTQQGQLACGSTPGPVDGGMACSREFDRCTTAADCCDRNAVCANSRCASIN
jgi:hypothetical protein